MPNERQKSRNTIPFDDVVIRLWRTTYFDDQHTFHAQVRHTPIPLQGGSFRVDRDEQLEEFHHVFTGRVNLNHFFYDYTTPPDKSDPQLEQTASDLAELGDQLYDLLPVSVRDELPRLIQKVFENGRGVRLIIEASAGDQADRLLSLPWELLFFKETRVYPARSRRLLIVRRLLDAARHSPVEMTAPFDLVHVIADDPEQEIEADLQQMERDTIPEAIAPGTCVSIEKPGSVEKLLATLDKQPAQILHFLGHGEAPSEEKSSFAARGYLCFVNEAGKRQWVTGERLQHLLSGTPGLQLIVLNACDSASVVTTNVALDLVYSGFPYVVAMQAKMPQEAAKHFIRAFYSQLQEGQSIEYAVAAGRFEIAARLPGAIDWCLPVLYTNIGLAERPPLVQMAEHLGQPLFAGVGKERRVGIYHIILGGLHLYVGLLLLLSGSSQPLPDAPLIALTTGWLVIIPPLLVAWVLFSRQFEIPENWSRSTRIAFLFRLLASAAIGLGLAMVELFFLLILLAGFGFWALLSPPAQVLLLLPFLPIAILISYWTVRSHAQGFIATTQVEPETFSSGELIMLLAGYMMLLAPIGWLYFPDILAPFTLRVPIGNLVIGIMCFVLGIAIYRDGGNEQRLLI